MVNFQDILGQSAAIELISRAYKADRLPHGLIFAGPAGVGKATTARALAQLFLCEQPKELSPCGKCASCKVFDAGNHPDFHVVYRQLIRQEKESSKARDLSVDVIRPYLIKPAGMKSGMGRGKAFVVEEADLMNASAQNALLKTLEEPAGRTLIVLLTDQPAALLPTVRSRCQIVRFAPLDEKLVRDELLKRGIAKDVAQTAAHLTDGSLGVALRWIEDGVIDAATQLQRQLDELLSAKPVDDLAQWFAKAAEGYAEKQLKRDELTSKAQATREGLSVYLRIASGQLRAKMRTVDDGELLERLCDAVDAIAYSETALDANVTVALVLQQLSLKFGSLFDRSAAAS